MGDNMRQNTLTKYQDRLYSNSEEAIKHHKACLKLQSELEMKNAKAILDSDIIELVWDEVNEYYITIQEWLKSRQEFIVSWLSEDKSKYDLPRFKETAIVDLGGDYTEYELKEEDIIQIPHKCSCLPDIDRVNCNKLFDVKIIKNNKGEIAKEIFIPKRENK